MRKVLTWLSALIMVVGMGLVAPGAAHAAPFCGITWGSLAKSAGSLSSAPITNVRAGRHACFDRVVIDVTGSADGYSAHYTATVTREGSGAPLALKGGAFIHLVIFAPTHTMGYVPTYTPSDPANLVDVAGWQTLRQVAYGGSFEGYTTVGVGVRARLPFRVFVLSDPTRIVLDVAHYW